MALVRSTIGCTSNPTARFSPYASLCRPPPTRSSPIPIRKRPTRRNRTSGPRTETGFDAAGGASADRTVARLDCWVGWVASRCRPRRSGVTENATGPWVVGQRRRTRTGPWATPGRAAGPGALSLVRVTWTDVGRGRRRRTSTGTPGCWSATGSRGEAVVAAWPPGRTARAAGTGTPGRTATATVAVPAGRPARRLRPQRPRTPTADRRSPACSGHRPPSCCCPRPDACGV